MTLGIGGHEVHWIKEVAAKLQEIVRDRGANAIHITANDDYVRFSIRLSNELLYTAKKYDGEKWEYTASTSGKYPIDVHDIAEALEGSKDDSDG